MSQKRGESAADTEVALHLVGLGFTITAREVRTWRTDGLLEKAIRLPQGYARTVLSENSPGTMERAEVIARITGHKRMSKRDRVLTLIFNRETVAEPLVRWALSTALRDMDSEVRKFLGGVTDPTKIQAAILERLRGKKPRGRFLNFLYSNVVALPYTPKNMELDDQHQFVSSVGDVMVCCLLGLDVYKLATADSLFDRDAIDETVDVLKIVGLGLKGVEHPEDLSTEEAKNLAREHLLSVYDGASLLDLTNSINDYSLEDIRWLDEVAEATVELARLTVRNERRLKLNESKSGMSAIEALSDSLTGRVFNLLLVGKRLGDISQIDANRNLEGVSVALEAQRDMDTFLNFADPEVHEIIGAGEDWPRFPVALQDRAGEELRAFGRKHGDVMERMRLRGSQ